MTLLEIVLHASQLIFIVYLIIKARRQKVEIECWKDKLLQSEINHLDFVSNLDSISDEEKSLLQRIARHEIEAIKAKLNENGTTRN